MTRQKRYDVDGAMVIIMQAFLKAQDDFLEKNKKMRQLQSKGQQKQMEKVCCVLNCHDVRNDVN